MQKENTSIDLISCGKTFKDGTRALEKINLNIKGGETVVLLGPSGCGKTTLLRIIAGLEEPDDGGQVIFNKEDVTELFIEKRNVGMVFQSYALFPNMNVKENIGYGLKVRKLDTKQIDDRVSEMLNMMSISDLSFRTIDQLSGGQRQRVALARAIAVRPRVLLLDEPLTALDAILRDRLRGEIDSLLRSLGITAIYVTHDQSEAMALGDRIVVMSDGKKTVAQAIVYGAFDIVKEKLDQDPLKTFEKVMETVRPQVEVRSRRVGGSNYQVPMPVPARRQNTLAFRWIITASKARKEKGMRERLAAEFIEILEGKNI